MAESISQKFILELVPLRDPLFAAALGVVTGATGGAGHRATAVGEEGEVVDSGEELRQAELLLTKVIRSVFGQYVAGVVTAQNLAAAVRQGLGVTTAEEKAGISDGVVHLSEVVHGVAHGGGGMPAACWARLAAAVQVEAMKLPGAKALNPDSVLLSPDPLLAPKKTKPMEDLMEGLGFTATQRFATVTVIAVVLGLSLTIYLTTRRHSKVGPVPQGSTTMTQPVGTEAASMPATLPGEGK